MRIHLESKAFIFFVCLFFLVLSCQKTLPDTLESNSKLKLFYLDQLDKLLLELDAMDVKSPSSNLAHYRKARYYFKGIEPIMAFIDKDNYKSLNDPNILNVDEEDATSIKITKPFGFQVIEEMMTTKGQAVEPWVTAIEKTKNRIRLMRNNTHIQFKKYHIIWLIRDQIARIGLTGITGFDSPILNASLEE